MSHSNLITKKQLSPDQRKGLAEMLTFMRDASQREMVLTGAAGTGKTSLLHVFLKELSKEFKKIKVYCTAYTNEAVRVISQRSGKNYAGTSGKWQKRIRRVFYRKTADRNHRRQVCKYFKMIQREQIGVSAEEKKIRIFRKMGAAK